MKKQRMAHNLAAGLGLAGCIVIAPLAGADELPEQEFELAQNAIAEAQEVDAGSVASNELLSAQKKLQQARDYNEEGEEEVAKRLVRQSMLHSEYAEVQALHAMAMNSLEDVNGTLETLEQELRRQ